MSISRRNKAVGYFFLGALTHLLASTSQAGDTRVLFDIPSKVECRDVTPEKCAQTHPDLMVVEAKFRISAGFVEGGEATIEDFVYLISSPDLRLKVLDFLPNTTLESSTADDRIEVTDSTESADALSGETHVAYSIISLGGSKNSSSKKTASNHYEKVAPKNLVLASGTLNRGYGVFYKLRPSTEVSLEGAKEFVLLCIVPKTWRGDWCIVTCSARSHKKASSSSWAISGMSQAHVGLYLAGEREASELADELTEIQLSHDRILAKRLARDAALTMDSFHASPNWHHFKVPTGDWLRHVIKRKPSPNELSLETAKMKLLGVEDQLTALSGRTSLVR